MVFGAKGYRGLKRHKAKFSNEQGKYQASKAAKDQYTRLKSKIFGAKRAGAVNGNANNESLKQKANKRSLLLNIKKKLKTLLQFI